eukprot:7251548-Prymnesium_polylepis.1
MGATCSAPGPTENSPLRYENTGDALGKLKRVMDKEKTRLRKPRRTTSFWLSALDEEQWAEDYYGRNSYPAYFLRWLNSHKMQAFIVCLLLVDVAVVAAELFLDAEVEAVGSWGHYPTLWGSWHT